MRSMPAVLRSPMTWLLVIVAIDSETGPADVYGDALPPYAGPDTATGLEVPRIRTTPLPDGVEVIAVSTGVEPTAGNYPRLNGSTGRTGPRR